ncbi:hypothetical protein [Streptomyces sp. NPDC055400]
MALARLISKRRPLKYATLWRRLDTYSADLAAHINGSAIASTGQRNPDT